MRRTLIIALLFILLDACQKEKETIPVVKVPVSSWMYLKYKIN